VDAVVTDPPYGMNWDADSTRFSGGSPYSHARRGDGRADWKPILNDDRPFDPSPWVVFPTVVMWGYNHYAARLPVGTTLIWIKKTDNSFGAFLSDAEIAWMKGGYGVYCFRDISLLAETNDRKHPNQKPLPLTKWTFDRAKIQPDALILDPFMGSGTTGVAAMQTGRRFVGIEIDPTYYEIAERRIKAAEAQLRLDI
jgi:DNA modification methylase